MHDLTQKGVVALTIQFAHVFVRQNILRRYDIVIMFESNKLTLICLKKSTVRKGYYDVLVAFFVQFW